MIHQTNNDGLYILYHIELHSIISDFNVIVIMKFGDITSHFENE